MRIGVISDTHIPTRIPGLPGRVHFLFKGVNHILHAGDIESPDVLLELETLAPVTAVAGNMDLGFHRLPFKRDLVLGDYKVGLIHGYGCPRNRIRESIRREFTDPRVIVYGHTHQAYSREEDGILFLNPGSPVPSLGAPPTVAILTLEKDRVCGELIPL